MARLDSLRGWVRVRITSADVEEILTKINQADVRLHNVQQEGCLAAALTISGSWYHDVKKIAERSGAKVEVIERIGLYWRISSVANRPILILGLVLYFVLICYVPTRIFFVKVDGNSLISDGNIADSAAKYGVYFGSSRREIRNEKVKNGIMADIPQLQWVGVNTYGCVARITVKERAELPEKQTNSGIHSVVAKCDGIIESLVVTKGDVKCKVGQAVTTNQVLISGYTDCGISIKATSAEGEVFGKTIHELRSIMPLEYTARTIKVSTMKKYGLIFGKKQINLYKDSGILGMECVKMYEQKYLTLPGGFQLPVGWVTETYIVYDTAPILLDVDVAQKLAQRCVQEYLQSTMVAGSIQSWSDTVKIEDNTLFLSGKYFCREMIGKVYVEEIVAGNEQGFRKNR